MDTQTNMEVEETVDIAVPRKRPWRKYLKRALMAALILAVLLRAAVPLALPSILERIASSQGLHVSYSKLDLSLFNGSLELWDVKVSALGEGEETEPVSQLGELEFLTLDVDLSALFSGTLRAHRVEIDGLDVYARRDSVEEGWSWQALLPGETQGDANEEATDPLDASDAKTPVADSESGSEAPFDWSLGFEVAAIRLQHVQLHVQDRAVAPAFVADLELNVRLSHLGLEERSARLEIFAHSLAFLDGFSVVGSLSANGPDLQVQCAVDMRGLRPMALETYLAPLGVVPLAQRIDCGLKLDLTTQAANAEATALDLRVWLRDVRWSADGAELLALDEVTLAVPNFSRTSLRAETARIRGVRGQAMRTASGALAIAGFRLHGVPASTGEAQAGADAEPVSEGSAGPFDLLIPKLELSEVALNWQDEAILPNVNLDLELASFSVGPLQEIAGQSNEAIHVELQMSVPGVVESMTLQGDVQAFADVQTVDLQMAITGLKPERAAPYLNMVGLRSDFEAGAASAQVQLQTHVDLAGVRHLEASLNDVELKDGGTLFALQAVSLVGLRHDGAGASTSIEELNVIGTRLKVRRDGEGLWHVLGLVLDPESSAGVNQLSNAATAPEVQTEQSGQAAAPATEAGPPQLFELARLACTDTRIEILDESMQPQVHQVFDDLGLVLSDFSLGGEESADPRAPASLELWFRAEGLAERLALTGTLASKPGPLDLHADLKLVGQGLELTAAEPWLNELGIESLWQDASLGLQLRADVQQLGDETHLALQLANLKFENQGQSWLSLGALNVPGVVLSDAGIRIQPIAIEKPEILLHRDGAGVLQAMALRFHPRQEVQAPNRGPQPVAAPAPSGGGRQVVNLEGLQIQGVRVRWQDEAVQPAVDTALRLDLSLANLVLGESGSGPMDWQALIAVDGNLDSLRVEGKAWLDPEDMRFQMEVAMEGLRPGSLGAYMPPNVAMELTDGRLSWNVQARYAETEAGGHSLKFEAQDLIFKDGEAGADLIRLPRLALIAPILDPEGQRFDITELGLKGLTLPVRIDTEGRMHGLGFAITPTSPGEVAGSAPEAPVQDPEEPESIVGGSQHVEVSKASDRILPLVTLSGLDVGIERFTFVDERGGVPLDFGLHLTQVEAMTLLGPEAADLPAMKFKIAGAVLPIVDAISVDLEIAPYATEPTFEAYLLISSVHGDQLTRVLPGLAETLDGSAWTDGQVEGHVQAQLLMRRRGPLDFDMAQGFGLELVMDHVAVRASSDGPALLGFEELTASVVSIRPATGDVHVKRVEWVQPFGSAWQDAEGLHAAGWVLKTSAPAVDGEGVDAPESTEPTTPPSEVEGEEMAAAAPTQVESDDLAGVVPAPEIRVDEFLISGGTFRFEDRSVTPAFVFPIDDVDFQLKRFSTRTLEEPRPFSFRLSLYGGDIELPERTGGGNLIGGLLGSMAALVTEDAFEPEDRPVFDELVLRGKMSVGPMPKGWVQLRLRGFELPAVSGLASEAGVSIGDGLMGESAMVHFDGMGGLRISSLTHFSYLSLSEPPGGPISSYLKLPAPLDTVLFVLKDEDGDHGIPLHVTLDEGGASLGTILGAVTKTLGLLIGEALASAPMRMVSGVLDLAGLEAEPIELTGDEWVELPYGAGVVQAPGAMAAEVAPLLELLRRDPSLYLTVQHALGSDDVGQAKVLANPSREECLDLAAFYRSLRTRLLLDRDDAASEVHVAYAMGQPAAVRVATASLKSLDAELGRTETALDRVLERTRDSSERAQLRRTKSAALEVSRRRLKRVEAFLRSAKISSIGTRLDVRRPRFSKLQDQPQGTIRISVARRR